MSSATGSSDSFRLFHSRAFSRIGQPILITTAIAANEPISYAEVFLRNLRGSDPLRAQQRFRYNLENVPSDLRFSEDRLHAEMLTFADGCLQERLLELYEQHQRLDLLLHRFEFEPMPPEHFSHLFMFGNVEVRDLVRVLSGGLTESKALQAFVKGVSTLPLLEVTAL
jgi:hypothetical protein